MLTHSTSRRQQIMKTIGIKKKKKQSINTNSISFAAYNLLFCFLCVCFYCYADFKIWFMSVQLRKEHNLFVCIIVDHYSLRIDHGVVTMLS